MNSRDIFLNALTRKETPRPATGSATSMVTTDLMEKVGVSFPEAHTDAECMAKLAESSHTVLGFDNVMPLYSVWHESAALGCKVNWGDPGHMPDSRGALYKIDDTIAIPDNLLSHPACKVPLEAIALLKKRIGGDAAVVGKAFGPWTLGYHLFGVEEFLINTLLKPDLVKRAMERLKEVTVAFAMAQIEAGADALCLPDHATRDLCSPDAYREFLVDMHCELAERIPCPLILHICGDTADRIEYIRKTGIECFHYDSKVPDATARELAGDRLSLMGGSSNMDIVFKSSPETIQADVRAKIDNCIDIIGPECAVPLNAPYENLMMIADAAKKFKKLP